MKPIHLYKFQNPKYTWNLPISVVSFDEMREDLQLHQIYKQDFYSIAIITEGDEHLTVRGNTCRIGRGSIITVRPNEICKVDPNIAVKGWYVAFVKHFIVSLLKDTYFLNQFDFFNPQRVSPFLVAEGVRFDRMLDFFLEMRSEVVNPSEDTILRTHSLLYSMLVYMKQLPFAESSKVADKKGHAANHRIASTNQPANLAKKFASLVSEHLCHEHHTSFYATKLCITPNYLNKIVRNSFHWSAKEYIIRHLVYETCIRLRHTTLTVQQIADELGFESATYLTRIFRRYTGTTPSQYRIDERIPAYDTLSESHEK